MKIASPKPFTFINGESAVLLLHGFTGTTGEIKRLGRYLQAQGYTVHGPLYTGHGKEAEELLKVSPEQWWEDAVQGYQYLEEQINAKQIFVAGVSLGGLFALKIAARFPIDGVISMCAPLEANSKEALYKRVIDYANEYKTREGKNRKERDKEINSWPAEFSNRLTELQHTIIQSREEVRNITSPSLIMQGGKDHVLYQQSAEMIYQTINTWEKELTWYHNSGHIITVDQEKEKVFQDITNFLTRWRK